MAARRLTISSTPLKKGEFANCRTMEKRPGSGSIKLQNSAISIFSIGTWAMAIILEPLEGIGGTFISEFKILNVISLARGSSFRASF